MPSISYDEFMRQIDAGNFEPQPVMAAAGGESYLRTHALETLKEELRARSIDIERFNDEERDEEALLSLLRSGSLFGGGSAVVLNSQRVGQKRESIVRFKEGLLGYFDRPSTSNYLLINGVTWSGNLAVPRRVKKDFLVIDCPEFKPWQTGEVERAIVSIAQRQGLGLDSGIASELREICGGELGAAAKELEKLALIVEGRALTKGDLKEHLHYRGDDLTFDLVDAIVVGDRRQALSLAASFVGERDQGRFLMFMGLLESNLRKLVTLSEALAGGASDSTALKESGYNPRHPKRGAYVNAAKQVTNTSAARVYAVLLEMDFVAKGSMSDIGAAFVTLAGRLCDERLRRAS